MAMPTFDLALDFTNDGLFTGTGEDVSSRIRRVPGIRCERGRGENVVFAAISPISAGKFSGELDNRTGDYDPDNPLSPLAGNLEAERDLRLRLVHDAVTYDIWRGILADLPQHPEGLRQSVGIPAYGRISRLAGKERVSTALYQNITTDVAIGHLLTAIGETDTAIRVFDTGLTTLAWWWLDRTEDPITALNALVYSEGPGAYFGEDAQGRYVFHNRHRRLTNAASTTSQATFRATGTEPLYAKPFGFSRPRDRVINVCTVTHKTREAQAIAEIWALGSTLTLAPNEARSFDVRHASGDPFTGAATPTTGDGDYTLTSGSVTPTLDRTSGSVCTLTMTAGSSGATVTGLRVRAQLVTVTYQTEIANTIDTTTSQNKFRRKPFILPTRAEIDLNTLQDFTNAVVGVYKSGRAAARIRIVGTKSARMTSWLPLDVGERITIVNPRGNSDDYFVEHLVVEAPGGPEFTACALSCEKADDAGYWILGDPTYGVLGTTTRLGF